MRQELDLFLSSWDRWKFIQYVGWKDVKLWIHLTFFQQINLNFQAGKFTFAKWHFAYSMLQCTPFFYGNSNHAGLYIMESYDSQFPLGDIAAWNRVSVFLRFPPPWLGRKRTHIPAWSKSHKINCLISLQSTWGDFPSCFFKVMPLS